MSKMEKTILPLDELEEESCVYLERKLPVNNYRVESAVREVGRDDIHQHRVHYLKISYVRRGDN